MTPAFQSMYGVRVYTGDNRIVLPTLPAGSVHCVVTSPPYWGQRDYGTATWEGGDPNCDHSGALVKGRFDYKLSEASAIQASRAARETGTDGRSYKNVCPCGARRIDQQIGLEDSPDAYVRELVTLFREVRRVLRDDGTVWLNLGDKFINKQLQMLPARVALAMQADGWLLRSDCIWHRVNAMPGSQRDRPTCNHEYMFLFAKQENYYYDDTAIREPSKGPPSPRLRPNGISNEDQQRMGGAPDCGTMEDRTKRSVWTIPVGSDKSAHFASYPPKLILPCILAGTSEHGVCATCGSPYRRLTTRDRVATRPGTDTKVTGDAIIEGNRDPQRHVTQVTTTGWEKTCGCATDKVVPAVVLDPFGGTGTSACVAIRKKRRAILIELNPDYVEIQKRKLTKAAGQRGFGL